MMAWINRIDLRLLNVLQTEYPYGKPPILYHSITNLHSSAGGFRALSIFQQAVFRGGI
jgi:hypothetical protein